MSNLHVKYFLIGAGLAGSAAAQAIRELDAEGSILLVGREVNRPYHRPPLSKGYLRREIPRSELFALPADWFKENRVQLHTGRSASHLDVARHTVTLDNGEEYSFDKLLLATGGTVRRLDIPGTDLPNLFYLRTIDDVERLHHAIAKAQQDGRPQRRNPGARGRAIVIGAGLLGVEIAASLTQLGIEVNLVTGRAWPWAKFAGENTGRFLARYLEKNGVTVHADRRAVRLEGDGRVQRVVLSSDESFDCDFAVAATGMRVNRELLRGTPIAASDAILADDHCRTNVEHIYAAGDCCAVFDPLFQKHRLIDHWDNAIVTGRIAGRNMAGADERYDAVNYFSSEVFTLRLAAWGEARLVDRRLIRGVPSVDAPAPDFVEIGVDANNRVAQIVALGSAVDDQKLRDLVRGRVRVDGNEERLKDPLADLGAL